MEGAKEMRARVYGFAIFGAPLIYVLPIFGSPQRMTWGVKCKAVGLMCCATVCGALFVIFYQELILVQFFAADDIISKFLLRSIGKMLSSYV